jgi:tetratricopeptide (TPR) repeat protein
MVVLRAILYTMAALMVCAAAFVAGIFVARQTARPPVSPDSLETVPGQEEHARELVESALAARFANDNTNAIRLFNEAAAADKSLKGLDYQRGLCLLQSGDFPGAEAAANASLAKNQEVANAYALLVMSAAGRASAGETTDQRRVAEWARNSRAKDPLSPFVHYAMGEYTRAVGQPSEAVAHYRKALERVSGADSFLVATVKAGLAGLRLKQDSEQKPVMPSIGDENIPPEWLFFAAAQALLDGDKATAQAFLARARQVVRPEIFDALARDSFFQDYLPEGISNNPQP